VNNGSTWSFVGSYEFRGDISDAVIISEAATGGTYVVADAIKFVTYDTTSTDIKTINSKINIASFELLQNFPNPFNPKTIIRYKLSEYSTVNLSIFNVLGQKVTTLISEKQSPGLHEIEWDASNVPAGIYQARLQTEFGTQTKKLILLK
jgi:hypothetical protein